MAYSASYQSYGGLSAGPLYTGEVGNVHQVLIICIDKYFVHPSSHPFRNLVQWTLFLSELGLILRDFVTRTVFQIDNFNNWPV